MSLLHLLESVSRGVRTVSQPRLGLELLDEVERTDLESLAEIELECLLALRACVQRDRAAAYALNDISSGAGASVASRGDLASLPQPRAS